MSAQFGFGGGVPDREVEQQPARGDGVRDHGAVVVDADSDRESEQNTAVVINTPPATLDEWVVYRDDGEEVTVADDNPAYRATDEVIVVAFEEDLDEVRPDYEGDRPLDLAELDCRVYAFPPRRLRRVGTVGEKAEDTPADTSEGANTRVDDDYPNLEALSERLGEAADVVVEDGEPGVEVEKLGVTHHISADGSVDGGPMADQLAEAAAEVLGGESQ